MRVTGNRMIELATAASTAGQSRVASAAQEVTSGLRVTRPSDDPSAYVSAERARLQKHFVEGSTTAVQTSRDRLTQVDGALAAIGEAVSQIRSIAIQGNNASFNATNRAQMAAEVRTLAEAALGAANVRAPDGEYLLAGSASLAAPFSATGVYSGNADRRTVATSPDSSVTAAISGEDLTAANGVDVLPLMERVAAALAANDTTTLSTTIDELATAIGQVGLARTRVGGSMGVLDATMVAHGELDEALTKTISNEVEADSIEAASNLARASQALEFSRSVTSHLIALLRQT